MTKPDPMPLQWANVDELVANYARHLRENPTTTSDIAVDLLSTEVPNELRFLVMFAATAMQALASAGDR